MAMARRRHRRHPVFRKVLGAGLLAGAAYAVWRTIEANKRDDDVGWEPQPFPFPPQPRNDAAQRPEGAELASERPPAAEVPSAAESERGTWVSPNSDACPASHPVKAKMSSGIYHLPGGMNYDRTKPDRCYVDAAAAEADGLRPSKI